MFQQLRLPLRDKSLDGNELKGLDLKQQML
jgi:hypothetical protein